MKRGMAWVRGELIPPSLSSYVSSLREHENQAKAANLGIWTTVSTSQSSNTSSSLDLEDESGVIEGLVVEVISGDAIVVLVDGKSNRVEDDPFCGELVRVYIASIRCPRREEEWAWEAKEKLRSVAGGKKVSMKREYEKEVRGGDGNLVFYSVKVGNKKKKKKRRDVAEMMVEEGWGTVMRRRNMEVEVAPNYDDLIRLEGEAIEKKIGIHSPSQPPEHRWIDVTRDAKQAKQHIGWMESSNSSSSNLVEMRGLVDRVLSPNRIIVRFPSHHLLLLFTLPHLNAIPQSKQSLVENFHPLLRLIGGKEVMVSIVPPSSNPSPTVNLAYLTTKVNSSGGGKEDLDVGEEMLKLGLATLRTPIRDENMYTRYYEVEREAKASGRGVWEGEEFNDIEQVDLDQDNKSSSAAGITGYVSIVDSVDDRGLVSLRRKGEKVTLGFISRPPGSS